MTDAALAPKKRTIKPKTVFQLPDGKPVSYKGINKFLRDVIRYHNGATRLEKAEIVTVPDANLPLGNREIIPDPGSPICDACGLDQTGCRSPYMEYVGAENPVATILVESISRKEDDQGCIGGGGMTSWLAALIYKLQEKH